MKELSIEEKAKRYDEVLEEAKSFYVLCKKCGAIDTINFLENTFPELKESEDEKIRKELKHYLEVRRCQTNDDEEYIGCNHFLAWLEKQGEQPRYSIGDVLCDKSCTTLNKDAQHNFEIVDIRNGMYICDKGSFPISQQDEYELVAKKIEQKPAEWSEEDEHWR